MRTILCAACLIVPHLLAACSSSDAARRSARPLEDSSSIGLLEQALHGAAADKFERPDNISVGTNWVNVYSGFSVTNGQAVSNGHDGSLVRWHDNLDSSDHYAQLTVREGHDLGVYVRMNQVDDANGTEWYSFRYYEQSGGWAIVRQVAGAQTYLKGFVEAPPAYPYTVRLVARGASLTAYVNGVEKVSVSDASLAHRGVGMFAHAAGRKADNFQADAWTSAEDNFDRTDSSTVGANWVNVYQGFSVVNGEAVAVGGDGSLLRWHKSLDSSDHYAQLTVRAGHDVGVYVRMNEVDDANGTEWYSFRYYEAANAWAIIRQAGGAQVWLHGLLEAPPAFPYTVRLLARGSKITGLVNGVEKVTVSDSALAHTGIGIFAHQPGRKVDTFAAGNLISGSNGDAASTEQPNDSDCDGISDERETALGLSSADPTDAVADLDGDGVDNQLEATLGGNPRSADSDGDGISDDPDLFNGTDFDGDGVPFANDNCRKVGNPRQEDADGDGIGDLCDDIAGNEGASAPVSVARDALGRYIAMRTDFQDMGRLQRDQKGFFLTGTTYRIFDAPFSGSVEVEELWHQASGRHAYATSNAEVDALRTQDFRVIGTIGFAGSVPLALGEPMLLRRFRHGSLGDALTSSPQESSTLLASGYQELAAAGYVLRDYGEMRKPDMVARFRDLATNRVVHTSTALNQSGLVGLSTEGYQFSVLSGPNGGTVPLRRLQNTTGDEILSTSESESFAGYTFNGVIGFVHPVAGSVSTTNSLVTLYRLTAPNGRHEHRASLAQAQALVSQGYGMEPIARVMALPGSIAVSNCAGAVPAPVRTAEALSTVSDEQRPGAALLRFVTACRVRRAINGQASTGSEQRIAELLSSQNTQGGADLRAWADDVLSLSASQRAALLGDLAYLDPGDCSQVADDGRVGQILHALNDTGPKSDTGGTRPVSWALLRTPHCEGVTYAAGAPGQVNASRAVVAVDDDESNCTGFEGPSCTAVGGRIAPTLHGVLSGGTVPAGSPAEAFRQTHPEIGLDLHGLDIGPCTASCSPALGQFCSELNRCRQYPIVAKDKLVRFSVSNAWDTVTQEIEFQELDPATRSPVGQPLRRAAEVNVVLLSSTATLDERSKRCDAYPAGEAQRDPAEEFLEFVETTAGVPSGKLYRVRSINKNGSYYRAGDVKSLDPAKHAEAARTIHVCALPNCAPLPNPQNAACSSPALASCSGAVGVAWNTPPGSPESWPRSLERCIELDPLGTANVCPETPREFKSSDRYTIIYVSDPEPTFHVHTRLSGVHCVNETGIGNAPNVNPDEVMVQFIDRSTNLLDLQDIENADGSNVIKLNLNAGDKRRPRRLLGSVPITLSDTAIGVLSVGENDFYSWKTWLVSAASGIVASHAALGMGVPWWGVVAAGGSAEFASAAILVATDWPDPDDAIGRAGWVTTVNDIQTRGTLAHDSNLNNEVPTLRRMDSVVRSVTAVSAGAHPAVDLTAYSSNDQILSCSGDAGCGASKRCHLGACVPINWTDSTLPDAFNPITDTAGTIERWDMNGARSDYRIYISTSLATKPALE